MNKKVTRCRLKFASVRLASPRLPRQDRIKPLLRWVEKYFPNVSTETYTPWAGLRPMTPNMMPITGESKMKGVYYHAGHGHLGWTLSSQTAQIVADKIDSN